MTLAPPHPRKDLEAQVRSDKAWDGTALRDRRMRLVIPRPDRPGSVTQTLATAAGSALAMAPLSAVFTDWLWLLEAWAGLAVVTALLCVLRIGRTPQLIHDAFAVIALAGFLIAVHLSAHAWLGVIPTGETMHDLAELQTRAADLVDTSRPPVESTPSLRLISTASLVAMAIVIDAIAVVGRARALAGLPILVILTAGASIARASVGIWAFLAAGLGYLLILAAGTAQERRDWTESGAVHAAANGAGLAGGRTGGRIAASALALAVIVSLLIPIAPSNSLSGMFSNGGGSGAVALSAYAKLKGSLNNTEATPLLQVTMAPTPVDPFYLRDIVLDTYSSRDGWSSSGGGQTAALKDGLAQSPATGPVAGHAMSATVQVLNLADTSLPTFGTLQSIAGVSSRWKWNRTTATIAGGRTSQDDTYKVAFNQPTPTALRLQTAEPGSGQGFDRWLALPDDVPQSVVDTTHAIVAGRSSAYAEVLALSDYFTDPANGFVYNTTTPAGDTGDDLSDFLTNKTGFCQQYAGAMAVMVRALGIPARVVLGYTHTKPGDDGAFTVTTRDAHAWVEVYFAGIGWLPFDPTPLTGENAARDVPVPYAPGPAAPGSAPGASSSAGTVEDGSVDAGLEVPDEIAGGGGGTSLTISQPRDWRWIWAAGVLVAIGLALLAPAFIRRWQRRRRVKRAARTGEIWAWWQEYVATAHDLRIEWPDSSTLSEIPDHIAARLGGPSRAAATSIPAVAALAAAADRERFSKPPGTSAAVGAQVTAGTSAAVATLAPGEAPSDLGSAAIHELRSASNRRARLRALWWPASTVRPAWDRTILALRIALAGPRRRSRLPKLTG